MIIISSTNDKKFDNEAIICLSALIIPRKKRICLVGATCNDPALNAAAQQFKVPVLKSETGTEYIEDTTYNTYFILKQFEGSEYDALCKSAHRFVHNSVLYSYNVRQLKCIYNFDIERKVPGVICLTYV